MEGMDMDEFLEGGFNRYLEEDSDESSEEVPKQKKRKRQQKQSDTGDEDVEMADADLEEEEDEESDDLDDFEEHMKELEQLKETDPEFYKFMQEEESGLLEFGQKELEEKMQLEEAEALDTREALTIQQLREWEHLAMRAGSIKALKKLVYSFRVASHLNDDPTKEEGGDSVETAMTFRYKIVASGVFNHIIIFATKYFSSVFDKILDRPASTASDSGKSSADSAEEDGAETKEKTQKRWILSKAARWPRLRPVVKVFLGDLLHLLNQLSEPKMQSFILQQTQKLYPYVGVFSTFRKKFLKKMLELWGEGTETVKILAFMNIRQMALDIPPPFIDQCLKGVYLTFVKHAKFYSPRTRPTITFMCNCVIELYSIDFISSYQHAFVYIRQLAIHLRSALTAKDKNAVANVYNWQTINSVAVWVRLISTHPDQEHLRLLVYPVVQLLEAFIALRPSSRYLPLRLHIISMLNQIGESCGVYVNSGAYLIEVLAMNLGSKVTQSKLKSFDIAFNLKVKKNLIESKAYQDSVFFFMHELLYQYLALNAASIAFPELAIPIVVAMKKFVKACKLAQYRRLIQQLLERVTANIKYIQAKRNLVQFGPKQAAQAKAFADQVRDDAPLTKAYASFVEQKKTATPTTGVAKAV